jgi:hypothetical protein
MGSNVATMIDVMRNASTQTAGQGLAMVVDVVQRAYTDATKGGEDKRSEFNRWLIAFAAVIGAFLVLRGVRRMARLAFGLFWLWLFVGGGINHLHLNW